MKIGTYADLLQGRIFKNKNEVNLKNENDKILWFKFSEIWGWTSKENLLEVIEINSKDEKIRNELIDMYKFIRMSADREVASSIYEGISVADYIGLKNISKQEIIQSWKEGKILTEEENLSLPVPRLEIRYFSDEFENYNIIAVYSLTYKHITGKVVSLPFSHTRIHKSSGTPLNDDGILDIPYRDGSHIQNEKNQLNIPAYIVYNEKYQII